MENKNDTRGLPLDSPLRNLPKGTITALGAKLLKSMREKRRMEEEKKVIESLYLDVLRKRHDETERLVKEFGEQISINYGHDSFLSKVSDYLDKKIELNEAEQEELLNKLQRIADGTEPGEACGS